MDPPHPLKSLLQLQLVSDPSTVLNISYVLTNLTQEYFIPSPHLQKWTTRITSMLHSKDPGARWAALCLAHKTSLLSKFTMVECSQTWLGVALPLLSKNEPLPILKASIRFLHHVFSATTDVPEFQRQVVTPNIPKFSLALISLAEKQHDLELKTLVLDTIASLIPLHPTSHRGVTSALNAMCLRFLNGSAPQPTDQMLLDAASNLYAVLHLTGGKVGAANVWRKSIDETLTFSWNALAALRTTFPGQNFPVSQHGAPIDPLGSIPLNLDKLRCGVSVLRDLLRSTTQRPVQVPIGPLVAFCTGLLSCTPGDQVEGHIDPVVRAMEVAVVPQIWKLSCDLITSLAKALRFHLTPCLSRLTAMLTYHLEQKLSSDQRLQFLQASCVMLRNCHPLHSELPSNRLVKAILPSLITVLATKSETLSENMADSSLSKKSKKRRREYEGDEVFKISREVLCPNVEDGQVILAALNVLQLAMQNQSTAPAMHSLGSRVLLSMSLSLPMMLPSALSPDAGFHGELLGKVRQLCTEVAHGTTSTMSKSLGLVLNSIVNDGSEHVLSASVNLQHDVNLLLHPRGPPLVRSLPHVETLSLFRAEEGNEEIAARESLGIVENNHQNTEEPTSGEKIESSSVSLQGKPMEKTAQTVDTPQELSATTSLSIPVYAPKTPSTHPDSLTNVILSKKPPTSVSASTLPREPNTLPLSVEAQISNRPDASASTFVPSTSLMAVDDEEDEDMPAINMDSDSDG